MPLSKQGGIYHTLLHDIDCILYYTAELLLMAEKQTEFSYKSIELYKSESLGSGSYGGVYKAKCDGLLCAAKIMHPELYDLRDPGTETYLQKFREECHLLSLARHPNVVQYLGTYTDPDTRLPVLLMELCDESLTSFLERSPGPLSYHIEVNICHDIALALVYLHSNGVIHRDLTANNILMMAGPRAKITDFGMSKFAPACFRQRAFSVTRCPGNALYMSPESLDEERPYTAKLDIFSFGVIIVQILTRKFPSPTNRLRKVNQVSGKFVVVPEIERREAHLKLIPDTLPLKPVALECLKQNECERPSAQPLSERLSQLKILTYYAESKEGMAKATQAESSAGSEKLERATEAKELQDKILQVQEMIQKNLSDTRDDTSVAKEGDVIEEKIEQVLCEMQHYLQQKSKILEHSQKEKPRALTDPLQVVSIHKNTIRQQEIASRDEEQEENITTTTAAASLKLSTMCSKYGKKAPEKLHKGAATVYGRKIYLRPGASDKLYSYEYDNSEKWCRLLDNPNWNYGLAVIDGFVTGVGGSSGALPTNSLLSLSETGEQREWLEVFAPMPTKRSNATCVTTDHVLVVAGGDAVHFLESHAERSSLLFKPVSTVEVMNVTTKQWTTFSPLPQICSSLSAAVLTDTLYLAGDFTSSSGSSKSTLFSCSIASLLPPTSVDSPSHGGWKESSSVPATRSSLVSFGGDLLAIGGRDDSGRSTPNIYRYDPHTDSWAITNQMKEKRSSCFAVTPSEEYLVIVGGYSSRRDNATDSVEILDGCIC